MITTNIPTLQIHKLTEEQYEAAKLAGTLDENALYMTPDEAVTPESIGAAEASDLNALKILVGDTTVTDQINEAIAAIPEPKLTWSEIQEKPTTLNDFPNILATKIVTNMIGLTPDNNTLDGRIAATGDGVFIAGLMEPVDGHMAATKNYVDTAIASIPTPAFSATDDGNGNLTITLG